MWRKASPWLTGVLAAALILTGWRLKDAQSELQRMRDQVGTGLDLSRDPGSIAPAAAADRASDGLGASPDTAGEASDMSAEWEQAVPPMDS
jgi:hypothetical protein